MAINLMDLVKDQLGGQVLGEISKITGESAENTRSAVDAGIPAILGGLVGAASSPDGAAKLASAADDFDDGLLDNLGSQLGGGKHKSLMQSGLDMLGPLLGGRLGDVTRALSGAAGVGQESSRSLLGLLAPVVMGVISRQKRTSGLDAGGLANLLSSQKDALAGAMPSEMANALGVSGLTSKAADAVSGAAASASSAARSAGTRATAAADQAASSGGSFFGRFLVPLVAIVAVVWAALTYFGGDAEQAADVAEEAATGAAEAAKDTAASATDAVTETVSDAADATKEAVAGATETVTEAASSAADATTEAVAGATDAAQDAASDAAGAAGEVVADAKEAASEAAAGATESLDIGAELGGIFDKAGTTLSEITDVDSAKAALPQIEEMSTTLDGLAGKLDGLPEGVKAKVVEEVNAFMPKLDEMIAKLVAIPGVGDVVKPALETLKEKAAQFI